MKGLIIYDSKYGATRQYAMWLSQRLLLPFRPSASITDEDLVNTDFFLLGSPVYIGRLTLKKWFTRKKAFLQNKQVLFFIVCGSAEDKEKQTSIIKQNALETIVSPGNIYFLPGRVNPQQLSFADKIKLRMGAMFEKDPLKKKGMLTGMDGVSMQQLAPVISAANHYLALGRRTITRVSTI
ncbi:MAG TPA: flavodoxin domain-containing protein [Chitinophagaceae bacterium]|nr:flavodoxin domain-containing protein [Chitinophagaceae bacterium]